MIRSKSKVDSLRNTLGPVPLFNNFSNLPFTFKSKNQDDGDHDNGREYCGSQHYNKTSIYIAYTHHKVKANGKDEKGGQEGEKVAPPPEKGSWTIGLINSR